MSALYGEFFLHKRDSKLHASEPVLSAVHRARERGERVEPKPAPQIRAYLERFRVLFQPVNDNGQIREFTQKRNLEVFETQLLRKIGIQKENIPESYWELQRRLAREQGHGDVELSETTKEQLSVTLMKDQKESLHRWTSYLASPDSNAIPLWAKYWAFSAVVKLGKYDAEEHRFQHRSIDTVAPFPELNREALAKAYEAVEFAVRENIPGDWDPELLRLAKQGSFSSIYGHYLHELSAQGEHNLQVIEGSWRTYQRNSNPRPLVDSLSGFATGWCTAGYSTAKSQLRGGDFHIYYSRNRAGEDVIPRVAIRMEDEAIAEVRGIAQDQNLDPYIAPVVERKIMEFGTEGEKYQKKSRHMKMLTEIESLHKEGKPLSPEQLRFLWELDEQIQGFGYQEDPRVEELQAQRDFRSDLAVCFGTTAEHVSIDYQSRGRDKDKHIFSEGIVVHFGDLRVDLDSDTSWPAHIPQIILGDFSTNAEDLTGLTLPREIAGDLDIRSVRELRQDLLPEKYNGIINFEAKNIENITFLSTARGMFRLDGVERMSNVIFPPHLRSLFLGNQWAENHSLDLHNVQLPEVVDEHFGMCGKVIHLNGAHLPRKVGSFSLTVQEQAGNVGFPLEIEKEIIVLRLKSAKGLRLPESFTGSLEFDSLESAEGLKLPNKLNNLRFTSMESAIGLELPYRMTGALEMPNLKSAQGILFPREVWYGINLKALKTLDGLSLERPMSEEDQAFENAGGFVADSSNVVTVGYSISKSDIQEYLDRPENRTFTHVLVRRD